MFSGKLQRFINHVLVSVALMEILASTGMAAFASGTFQKTGSMNVARVAHTATLLGNGQVLVAGGENSTGFLASAELYNPVTGLWTLTGSMITPREGQQAVLLANGEVLAAGGSNARGTLASAELYSPSTGTWTATGSMATTLSGFSLTLLSNGEVLAVQGITAELYNPTTGTWTATGSPTSSVGGESALLQNGQVLAIGGSLNSPSELYNSSTGTWSATGSMGTTMLNPITSRFSNGEVFATSGFASSGTATYSTAALYRPSTGQWTLESGPCSCDGFNGGLLSTGKVLVAGGFFKQAAQPYPITKSTNAAELWDPSTQAWTSTGSLHVSRGSESMTILSNGQALVAGGETFDKQSGHLVVIASAELYTP